MFAYNTFTAHPHSYRGEHINKRKIQTHFIRRNIQVLAVLLRDFPEIYEVYAKRVRIPIEKGGTMSHRRAFLLEFYCKKHIPIVHIRKLELSLKRLWGDIYGRTIYFLFIRLSPNGEYKCMLPSRDIQSLYKSPRPLGLCVFQDPAHTAKQNLAAGCT